jgi:carbon-monoxide dehydrogenase medium subunit
MVRFEYHEPTSIAEAVELAARFGAEGRFLAGGTDLILQIQNGHLAPRHLIGLQRTPGLASLAVNGEVRLGGLVTHRTLATSPALTGALRIVAEAAAAIGGPQVRNVGTLGGNLVSASPTADLVPPLIALDASVELLSAAGERGLPLERFVSRPGRAELGPGELLLRATAPPLPSHSAAAFLKAGRRKALDAAIVSVAVRLTLDASLERCLEVRIVLGGVAERVIRARAAERALDGQAIGAGPFARAAELAAESCDPVTDVRASARFRRHLVSTLVSRALARSYDRVKPTS